MYAAIIIRLREGNNRQGKSSRRTIVLKAHKTSSSNITKDPVDYRMMTFKRLNAKHERYDTEQAKSGRVHVMTYIRDPIMRCYKFCSKTVSDSEA